MAIKCLIVWLIDFSVKKWSFFSIVSVNGVSIIFWVNAIFYYLFGLCGVCFLDDKVTIKNCCNRLNIDTLLLCVIFFLPVLYFVSMKYLNIYLYSFESLLPIILIISGLATGLIIKDIARKVEKP